MPKGGPQPMGSMAGGANMHGAPPQGHYSPAAGQGQGRGGAMPPGQPMPPNQPSPPPHGMAPPGGPGGNAGIMPPQAGMGGWQQGRQPFLPNGPQPHMQFQTEVLLLSGDERIRAHRDALKVRLHQSGLNLEELEYAVRVMVMQGRFTGSAGIPETMLMPSLPERFLSPGSPFRTIAELASSIPWLLRVHQSMQWVQQMPNGLMTVQRLICPAASELGGLAAPDGVLAVDWAKCEEVVGRAIQDAAAAQAEGYRPSMAGDPRFPRGAPPFRPDAPPGMMTGPDGQPIPASAEGMPEGQMAQVEGGAPMPPPPQAEGKGSGGSGQRRRQGRGGEGQQGSHGKTRGRGGGNSGGGDGKGNKGAAVATAPPPNDTTAATGEKSSKSASSEPAAKTESGGDAAPAAPKAETATTAAAAAAESA